MYGVGCVQNERMINSKLEYSVSRPRSSAPANFAEESMGAYGGFTGMWKPAQAEGQGRVCVQNHGLAGLESTIHYLLVVEPPGFVAEEARKERGMSQRVGAE